MPLAASTSPKGVVPIWVREQAAINTPPSTLAQLSFEPTFLRYNMLSPRRCPITAGIVGKEELKSETD
jgi:hypothetical protein